MEVEDMVEDMQILLLVLGSLGGRGAAVLLHVEEGQEAASGCAPPPSVHHQDMHPQSATFGCSRKMRPVMLLPAQLSLVCFAFK